MKIKKTDEVNNLVFHFQSGDENGLYTRICELLYNSIEAHFSVAWITMGAFDMINSDTGDNPSALDRFLDNDEARLVITVGLSGGLTSYNALDTLLKLADQCNGDLIVYVRHMDGKHQIFHPKAYLFRADDDTETLIVGSNNLSRHGLGQNEEASLELSSENGSEAIDTAKQNMFGVIENDDGEEGPSRLLTPEFLESLKDSGYVCKEGSKSWRKKKKKNSKSGNGLFTGGGVGGNLPPFGSGIPEIAEPEPEPEPEGEPEGEPEPEDEGGDLVYIGVPWGSEEHPIPGHNGIRFAMVTTLTDIAGGYGPPSPEIRIPSHNNNRFEQRAINQGLENVREFFEFPESSGYVNGNEITVFCTRMNGYETVELESNAKVWHNRGGSGGGSGYRLNITDPDILRCSTQGGGDVVLIDRTQQGYVIRFVPPPHATAWVNQMNRTNNAQKRYCFFNNGNLVELPDDD